MFTNGGKKHNALGTSNTAYSLVSEFKIRECHIFVLFAEIIFYLQRLHSYHVYIVLTSIRIPNHIFECSLTNRPSI